MPKVNAGLVCLTKNEKMLYEKGEAYLAGCLKYTNNNRIISHPPLSSNPARANKNVLIGVGVGVVIGVAATVATIKIVKHHKKKKLAKENPSLALSIEYNQSMVNYVKKVEKGTLSIKDIKWFAECFDTVLQEYDYGDIRIDLSSDEINSLYSVVYKFSSALCSTKNLQINGKYPVIEKAKSTDNKEKMEYIREMLSFQKLNVHNYKRIFKN